MQPDLLVDALRQRWPDLMAVYAFGSRIAGHHRSDSDLDLAILRPGYTDPVQLWEQAGHLADQTHCPVDLLDMRATSTVMQHQILTQGTRWWSHGTDTDLFEAAMLTVKLHLDEARKGILEDIQARGTVYGG